MKKIAISVLVLLALVLASCADSADTSDVLAARKAAGDITWKASYVDDAVDIIPLKSDRSNASGKGVTKITSNAHSSDCEGVYFRWENKQRDDGFLLVSEEIFETYLGFTLTAKVSNTYWDFYIAIQEGQKANADGLYVFSIPKGKWYQYIDTDGEIKVAKDNGCGKNINMVFIGDWKLDKDPIKKIYGETKTEEAYEITFTKTVTDLNFANGVPFELWKDDAEKFFTFEVKHVKSGEIIYPALKLGESETITVSVPYDGSYLITETIKGTEKYEKSELFVEPTKATKTISLISKENKTGGVHEIDNSLLLGTVGIRDHWKNELIGHGYDFDAAFKKGATFIWDTADSFKYGTSGSAIIHYTTTFKLEEYELEQIRSKGFPVNFAADNAAVLFVNDVRVGYTEAAISAEKIEKIEKEGFTDFSKNGFLDTSWEQIYKVNIADALQKGVNTVVFIAANSDDNDGTYNLTNNPCGLIFFGETVIESERPTVVYELENKKVLGGTGVKGGGTGLAGDVKDAKLFKVGTSWFTYAQLDLDLLKAGKYQTINLVQGNNSPDAVYGLHGKAFIKLVANKLEVTIDGRNVNYFATLVTAEQIRLDSAGNSITGGSQSLNPFTLTWNGEENLYLSVNSGTFYRWF